LILLAIDTCEARGGVAVRRDGRTLALRVHNNAADYSEWLLPAVDEALSEARVRMEEVGAIGVATGPGSFTGLRVGLTTVKAWAEVYGKRVVGVSRLEAMARGIEPKANYVGAFYNAQREQVFGALYRSEQGLTRVGDELVIPAAGFLELVANEAGERTAEWVSLDPSLITELAGWAQRAAKGDSMHHCDADVASAIGMLAEERAAKGQYSDPLKLDANYVRRSDAEIFWKRTSSGGR
jgi:tRNA threonylcarbamoyladenosine biosynthesis protein TsaB